MLKLRTGLALGALGLSLGAAEGCLVTNANHCALQQGACAEGQTCSMCAVENNGCVPVGVPIEDACMFVSASTDPGSTSAQTTTTVDPTTGAPTETTDTSGATIDLTTSTSEVTATSTGDTSAESSETTGELPPCTGEGIDNKGCGGDLPYCIDGSCVSCEDINCSEIEPSKPACAVDLGLCVECQDHGDCTELSKPACNLATATCMACNSHDQCPATACNLETGECFPQDHILYVNNTPDGETPCSDVQPQWGTKPDEAICTLTNAVGRLVAGQPTTIKIRTGKKPQNLPTVIPEGDYIVAIVHYENTVPSLLLSFNDPAITVSQGNTVFMNRITIYNSAPISDPLIACAGEAAGARLWLDRQRIFAGLTAIRANNCQVHVRRSTVTANSHGGIDIGGTDADHSKLWLENTYVTGNNGSKFGALRLAGAADASILYSTVALNESPVPPIECIGGYTGTLTIRNSAIVNPGSLVGGGCNYDIEKDPITSFIRPESGGMGELSMVFSGFVDGVYQAKIGGLLADVARWRTGDPAMDHDENLRPTMDDTPDYAGADRPVL